jgi:SAM-dependent methyltransferase
MLSIPRLRWVLPERGFPVETRRRWPAKYLPLNGKVVLVLGTGSGWDTLTWVSHRPHRIIAVEKYVFRKHWQTVSAYAQSLGFVTPEFLQADLGWLPFRSESVDAVVSDAVFEHCQDMPSVAAEISRVLRRGGVAYATYCPMWYCYGGDHFSGRGGLEHGYNHICLSERDYDAYREAHETAQEDAQSGPRFRELGLYSKLTTREYLEIYKSAGLEVADLILEVSHEAVEFRQRWPDRFDSLLEAHSKLTSDDLLVKANFVILRKQSKG